MAALDGKVGVVTGATSGIGQETAIALAGMGMRLALVCRDLGRGEATVAAIRERTGSTAVTLHRADLAVQADIRRVADELLAQCPRIDLLVNNAGIVNLRRETTPDGIEAVFATNHLAYFLLTLLLLPRLRESAPSRIVNVASDAHRIGRIDFDDLGSERRYKAMRVYGTSKLANILFTFELARRLAGSGVTVNCVHPGAVATRLGQNNGRVATLLTKMLASFFRTPAQGAATSIRVATDPALAAVTGAYFANGKQKRSSRASLDEAVARRLWEVSAELTNAGGLARV
jgi:NAD(P)-dependent dehydrogenase (short-subunit alcohol dehydrogenase family)